MPNRRSAVAFAAVLAMSACSGTTVNTTATTEAARAADRQATTDAAEASTTTTTTTAPTSTLPDDGRTAAQRTLKPVTTITGGLTPKSVVHSGSGIFFAQNMIYTHTITVYDRSFAKIATIPDRVTLSEWGYPQYQGSFQGGPVEMAFSADQSKAYVSNYQMYGKGFSNPGSDNCGKANWDPSFVYRIDMTSLKIDQVIKVGPVPKFVATTPDGRYVLVSNWCGYDLSVIDVAQGKEVRRIPLGPFPRGIVVTKDSATAYVAVMGSSDIAAIDLADFSVSWLRGVGAGPRHLVMDEDNRYMYATLNSAGQVAKIDIASRKVLARVASPQQPRSMAISDDGTALYVVNNASGAMSKIRTSDMQQVQRVATNANPIGITYDAATRDVWVACYTGSLMVFRDT